tara:strand:+ start:705 stop:1073 length:369 start_codon:yes stop_codon:yes gene_type:complete
MSDSSAPMEQFNINELAGATAIMLTGISGILVIILKSRCDCKFRVGISDKYNICMCSRSPPPDIKEDEEDPKETKSPKGEKEKEKPKVEVKPNIILREEQLVPDEPEPEPEIIIATNQNNNP